MAVKNTFLWRITGDQLPADSFLFGTMHVQDMRAFSTWDQVKDKIRETEAYAAEFHLDDKPAEAAGKMVLPPDVSLKDFVSEKRYRKSRKVLLKATGLNLDFFVKASPFLLTGLIGSQMLGKEMPKSLDEQLWDFAKSESKLLLGIETFVEQMEVLDKIPLEAQVKMLMDLIANLRNYRRHTRHMADLYEMGEMQRLSKSVRKNAKGLRKILLYHRNEVMADRIYDLTHSHSLFAAIGAGHLGGGKGVIRLLKRKGLQLYPVYFNR